MSGSILVRASDTDVLVILLGYLGKCPPEVSSESQIVKDCGVGKNRQLVNVTAVQEKLEPTCSGLIAATPGYHALTGCDFTSAFYR